MTRKLILALLALVLAAAPAWAQPAAAPATAATAATVRQPGPESLALARELLRVARVEEGIYRAFELGVRQGAGDSATPELMTMVGEAFRDEFKWAEVEPQISALYAGLFSDDELRAMTAWHQTPVGRRVAETTAELSLGSQTIMGPYMQALMPRIMERVQEAAEWPTPGGR
ncbi:DUF2059 domain-containing protein [Longimicrobium terrae]|uniref:DUF2059 domain-containing protein n=1 Tax=Longimicrobium terrae TaxID=1639882 RepID=A0A841H4S5_9BACT|nr:DUF2059 domain-containing protein [Longimicrobium terrae]MBB4638892.1 hypothetical protein [Longimicrobium terrae]MBB6073131.1 hypothetical protein [Longimicrobium terrae]NNC30182.1 DUF2059 domain-containing protein [Longimicrobium terrae]